MIAKVFKTKKQCFQQIKILGRFDRLEASFKNFISNLKSFFTFATVKVFLFKLIAQSALRANECLGLHVGSFTFGAIPEVKRALFRRVAEAGYSIFGYILLTDQPALDSLYDLRGKVPRGPLKSRPEVAPEYNRYIPLIDEEMAKELAALVGRRLKERKCAKADNLVSDLLIRRCTKSFVSSEKQEKSEKMLMSIHSGIPSPRSLRKCEGDKTVSTEILGQSGRIAERYVHLNEEIARNRHQEGDDKSSPVSKVKKICF